MWIIRTFLYWFALVVFTIVFSIMALFASFIDPGGNSAHQCARAWAKTLLLFAGVKVRLQGAVEAIDLETPYVFMANHQSAFDIFVLLAGLPVPFRWVAKAELFKIPIFGPSMRRAGYISINRDNPRDAVRSLNEAAKKIREGISVIVFPEGTRSEDGKLLPFKSGGFVLAIKSQAPIVPTALVGTFEIKPRGRFWVRPRTAIIRFGAPVETKGLKTRDKEDLKNRIHGILHELLKDNNITA